MSSKSKGGLNIMKIALGTNDHKTLSETHFGDSKFFEIYEWKNETWKLVEVRENITTKDNEVLEEERHGDPRKFKGVANILRDVDAFVAYRFGPNYLRIKQNTTKIPFLAKTRDIKEALDRVTKYLKSKNII